jgi:hypothetical protein
MKTTFGSERVAFDIFDLVLPLEGIPTNSRLLHRGYGPQFKLAIMLQYPQASPVGG